MCVTICKPSTVYMWIEIIFFYTKNIYIYFFKTEISKIMYNGPVCYLNIYTQKFIKGLL